MTSIRASTGAQCCRRGAPAGAHNLFLTNPELPRYRSLHGACLCRGYRHVEFGLCYQVFTSKIALGAGDVRPMWLKATRCYYIGTVEPIFFPDIGDGEDKVCPFKNRMRKTYRHMRKWAKRTQTNCFRIYDREIKAFPLAVDYYDQRFCVHYFTRSRGDDLPPEELVQTATKALSELFGAKEDAIYWRSRVRRAKREQYEKLDASKESFTVLEYGVKFEINLLDYLDTGLFLDHRETRQIVAKACNKKRLLNLFSYTASFSVHAAMQGASFTKSVDMSNTYTDWGRRNFELNGLDATSNEVVRADCMTFLGREIASMRRYDVIVIDPPTISRSKKMSGIFDVQEDYLFLLTKALELLLPGGVIYFSTNSRKFEFDGSGLKAGKITEISQKTLPWDFHDPKIHRCWRIEGTS